MLLAVAQSRRVPGALSYMNHVMSHMISYVMSRVMSHVMNHMISVIVWRIPTWAQSAHTNLGAIGS